MAEVERAVELGGMFLMEPTEVSIKEGMNRFRTDMGDITSLLESIKEKGQIQPIVINRENHLIVGARRLAACLLGGMKVKVIYEDMVDPVRMREWELEENLKRKGFTAGEEVLAVREIHVLKQRLYGETTSGKEGGWTLEQTAELLGKTKGSVIGDIDMAAMLDAFPQLRTAKKKSEIRKAAQGLQKLAIAMEGVKKHEEAISTDQDLFKILKEDAVKHMSELGKDSVDILCTDPLYGVDMDQIAMACGGITGGRTTAGYKIEDCREPAFFYYEILALESFRFTTNKAHGYVFVAPEHFWTVRGIFLATGWRVHVKPLIWIKREVGQCNVPSAWPASCYEMLMYLRKDDSKLVKEGQPDWIECPPIDPSKKLHPYEKPVPLLTNLLERVALPGQQMYDPFCGSASALEAGIKLRLFCTGVDNSAEAYANAVQRMAKVMDGIRKEQGDG